MESAVVEIQMAKRIYLVEIETEFAVSNRREIWPYTLYIYMHIYMWS